MLMKYPWFVSIDRLFLFCSHSNLLQCMCAFTNTARHTVGGWKTIACSALFHWDVQKSALNLQIHKSSSCQTLQTFMLGIVINRQGK